MDVENCYLGTDIENLTLCGNNEVVSGMSEVGIHYSITDHVKTFPKLPALKDNPNFETAAVAVGLFEMQETKFFAKIRAQMDTAQFDAETVGNTGNNTNANKWEAFIPGNTKKSLGMLRKLTNVPMVFLVRDKEGLTHMLGNENSPAYLKGNYTSGKTKEDDKGITLTIECTHPATLYEGAIPVKTT